MASKTTSVKAAAAPTTAKPGGSENLMMRTLSKTSIAARMRASPSVLMRKKSDRAISSTDVNPICKSTDGNPTRKSTNSETLSGHEDTEFVEADDEEDADDEEKHDHKVFSVLKPAGYNRLKKYWAIREVTLSVPNFGRAPKRITEISSPTNMRHTAHVEFDSKLLSFSGLPKEWDANVAYQQFGCSIASCPRVKVRGYKERIPAVLLLLREELVKAKGLQVEGVFRVAASYDDQKQYKQQVDTGVFKGCTSKDDAMCMAALIKEWFRTMPVRLLNPIPVEDIRKGKCDLEQILPEPNYSAFLWLCDLMAETVRNEPVNRMSIRAMSIVIAPNLYAAGESATPAQIMQEMNGVVSIVEDALVKFINKRKVEDDLL